VVVYEDGTCSYHLNHVGPHDRSYHEKIAKNILQPADSYLSQTEIDATMNGRYRGDGRRLDPYVSADPLLWEAPNASD
jgi:hypothetical protein